MSCECEFEADPLDPDDDQEELLRLYKALEQWKRRHMDDEPIMVQKNGESVYVWIPPRGEKPTFKPRVRKIK